MVHTQVGPEAAFARIAANQHLDPASLSHERVSGGFTQAEKYIVTGEDTRTGKRRTLFAKMGNLALHPNEAPVLDTEALMYQTLHSYDAPHAALPELHAYLRDESWGILLLEYLAGASWGGPWTEQNIRRLHQSITAIHATQLSAEDAAKIHHAATTLRETLAELDESSFTRKQRAQLLTKVCNPVTGEFTNSRGRVYWRASPEFGTGILQAAQQFDHAATPHLTIADVNFGNIGFGPQGVHIVDPVYVTMGDAASDTTGIGINILRILPPDETNLRALTKQLFLQHKACLADSLTYWLACTALPYAGREAWMDYHQECAKVGLQTWQQMYAD